MSFTLLHLSVFLSGSSPHATVWVIRSHLFFFFVWTREHDTNLWELCHFFCKTKNKTKKITPKIQWNLFFNANHFLIMRIFVDERVNNNPRWRENSFENIHTHTIVTVSVRNSLSTLVQVSVTHSGRKAWKKSTRRRRQTKYTNHEI
jgi:hypothetical protein